MTYLCNLAARESGKCLGFNVENYQNVGRRFDTRLTASSGRFLLQSLKSNIWVCMLCLPLTSRVTRGMKIRLPLDFLTTTLHDIRNFSNMFKILRERKHESRVLYAANGLSSTKHTTCYQHTRTQRLLFAWALSQNTRIIWVTSMYGLPVSTEAVVACKIRPHETKRERASSIRHGCTL